MAAFSSVSPGHIRAAIEEARAALREMEPEEVPASLRRVQASSARRLPPPLAAKLVAQLSSDEWLRGKVVERSEVWDVDAAERDLAASSLFLLQPDDWEARFAELTEEAAARESAANVRSLERRLARVESERDAARDKARQLAGSAERERAEAARRRAELKAEVGERYRPDPDVNRLQSELANQRAETEAMREELRDADRRIDRLKSDLLKARRSKSEGAEEEWRSWGRRDSLELARQLDALSAAVAPDAPATELPAQQVSPFELPAGVAPDSTAAMVWLIERTQPTTLIVDGYNVTWLLDPSVFSEAQARQQLLRRLGRLRRAAQGPLRVVVVFDSQHGMIDPAHGSPIEVRFAASADDEIRRLAAATRGDVVVVSTDREVREGSEGRRVVGLWSEALAGWRS